MTWKNMSNFIV